jgi:hypothetical protein
MAASFGLTSKSLETLSLSRVPMGATQQSPVQT